MVLESPLVLFQDVEATKKQGKDEVTRSTASLERRKEETEKACSPNGK